MVGKLIVATEESELGRLDDLYARGQQNGIEDLELLDAAAIEEREPYCRGMRAIFSPVTGIVDWGLVSPSTTPTTRAKPAPTCTSGHEVLRDRRARRRDQAGSHDQGRDRKPKHVITCGGLYADKLAQMTGGARDPKIVPFRGDYLILKPGEAHLVRGNIYPVPDPEFPFLGVHFTPRMDGSIWLGPNAVLAFAREGYSFFDINPPELWDALTYPGFFKLATKYWKVGAGEMYRDLVRSAYVKALQRYIPALTARRLPARTRPACARRRWPPTARWSTTSSSKAATASCTCATPPRRPRPRRSRSASTSPTTRSSASTWQRVAVAV